MMLTEHRLRRHRNRAGYAIGSGKTIHLFKYAAWLTIHTASSRMRHYVFNTNQAKQQKLRTFVFSALNAFRLFVCFVLKNR